MGSLAQRYRVGAVRKGLAEDRTIEIEASIIETHAHLRSWNQVISDRAEYLPQRSQAPV